MRRRTPGRATAAARAAALGAAGWVAAGCAALLLQVDDAPSRALPPPAALQASSGELRAVPLVWPPVASSRVAGYAIERSGGSAPFQRVAVVRGRFHTSYVDRDAALADGVRYRYRVRSVGTDGAVGLEPSPASSARTAGLPGPPRRVEAISHLPRRVALQWRPARDADVVGYRVERSASEDGPWIPVAEPSGRFETAWVDEDLGDLRVFYYRVTARNAAGVLGEPSAAVQAVTKAAPLPPLGLGVAEKRLGANRLAWEPNVEPDIAGYRLLRAPAPAAPGAEVPAGAWRVVAELPPESIEAVDAGVEPGQAVRYRLVAFDVDGLESQPSDPVGVESEDYGLELVPGDGGVRLAWDPRPDEGYAGARVYRVGALRRRELARVDDAAFVDRSAEPGGTYRYAVALERPDGTLAPASRVREVRLPPPGGGAGPGPTP